MVKGSCQETGNQRAGLRTSSKGTSPAPDSGKLDNDISGVAAALRAFVLFLFPEQIVVFGKERAPPAPPQPYTRITPISTIRLSTNRSRYAAYDRTVVTPFKLRYQLDFFLGGAMDKAATFTSLFRDEQATEWFRKHTSYTSPLYCDRLMQGALINESGNYEERWIVDALLQYNLHTDVIKGSTDKVPDVTFRPL